MVELLNVVHIVHDIWNTPEMKSALRHFARLYDIEATQLYLCPIRGTW